jgi:heme-degrading monooxygenase HmoA
MKDPSQIEPLRELWTTNGKLIEQQPGFRLLYHLESTVDPAEIRAISGWATREDADAYGAGEPYARIMESARGYYTGKPQVETYYVAEHD